jgi:hypothetical protein
MSFTILDWQIIERIVGGNGFSVDSIDTERVV